MAQGTWRSGHRLFWSCRVSVGHRQDGDLHGPEGSASCMQRVATSGRLACRVRSFSGWHSRFLLCSGLLGQLGLLISSMKI